MGVFELSIIEFSKTIYSGEVVMIVAPSLDGEIGILSKHTSIVAKLIPGSIRIFPKDREHCETEVRIENGFLVMKDNLCQIYYFN